MSKLDPSQPFPTQKIHAFVDEPLEITWITRTGQVVQVCSHIYTDIPSPPRQMLERGVEGDLFCLHTESSNCAERGCVPFDPRIHEISPMGFYTPVAPVERP